MKPKKPPQLLPKNLQALLDARIQAALSGQLSDKSFDEIVEEELAAIRPDAGGTVPVPARVPGR